MSESRRSQTARNCNVVEKVRGAHQTGAAEKNRASPQHAAYAIRFGGCRPEAGGWPGIAVLQYVLPSPTFISSCTLSVTQERTSLAIRGKP